MKQEHQRISPLVRVLLCFFDFAQQYSAPVNLIHALHTSLTQITRSSSVSLEERFKRHRDASKQIKDAVTELGLRQVATNPAFAANGMTAVGGCIFLGVCY